MSKVRINDLARELEVKSKSILDALTAVGVTEKKTHSSSIEEDEAEKVRGFLTRGTRPAGASRPSAPDRPTASVNLAGVSKPGDALKAILERKQADSAAKAAPPPPISRPAVASPAVAAAARPGVTTPITAAAPVRPVAAAPVATGAAAPARPAPPPPPSFASANPAPRRILPNTGPRPTNIVAPPPAIASRPVAGPVVARPGAVPPPPPPAVASVPPAAPVVVKPSDVPAAPAPVATAPTPAPVAAAPAPQAPVPQAQAAAPVARHLCRQSSS